MRTIVVITVHVKVLPKNRISFATRIQTSKMWIAKYEITSGKIVVRWFSQSLNVGFSPGRTGNFPARKSCRIHHWLDQKVFQWPKFPVLIKSPFHAMCAPNRRKFQWPQLCVADKLEGTIMKSYDRDQTTMTVAEEIYLKRQTRTVDVTIVAIHEVHRHI